MMICSSPENIRLLEYYREISQRLARAKGLNDQMAMELADKGKAVVWIDGGLHASEALGFTHLIEAVWRYASGNDPETLRILRDVIILFTHDNPDGQELISSWYMRRLIPAQRIYDVAPRLFEKYPGTITTETSIWEISRRPRTSTGSSILIGSPRSSTIFISQDRPERYCHALRIEIPSITHWILW
jgi:hypothetical protein